MKEKVVRERGCTNIRLDEEMALELQCQPGPCSKPYRIIALRKNLTSTKGEEAPVDDIKIFFFITNDWVNPPDELEP